MRIGVFASGFARAFVVALACALAGCTQGALDKAIATGGKLDKPDKIFVGAFEMKRGVSILDPGLENELKSRMSGLTETAARMETARRVERIFVDQLVASLRAAGLPAEVGSADNIIANTNSVIVHGTLDNLGADERRQRRVSAIGRSDIRIVAQVKSLYYADVNPRTLFDFIAEDAGGPTPPAPPPAAGAVPSVRLSPEIDAHVRRVAQAAATRVAAYAAEQGWVAARPTAAATPAPAARR